MQGKTMGFFRVAVAAATICATAVPSFGEASCDGDSFALQRAEFAKYYKQITGKVAPEGMVKFAVDPKLSKSGRDAYAIKSAWRVSAPDSVSITGSNMRSVWYGLYDLLERRGGCHWFWDGDVVPKKESIDLSNLDIHEEAHFEYRAIRYFAHRGLTRFQAEHWGPGDWKKEIDWILKRRLNTFMLRIGQDDLFQRTFPDTCAYPDPAKPLPGVGHSHDDRTLFWSLQYRGRLRDNLQKYAFERGLMVPEDFGTMTHWYSRTPEDFLAKKKPEFIPLANKGANYHVPNSQVWNIRDDKWVDEYWKMTKTAVETYGKGAPAPQLLHTIGLGERMCYKDRKKNFAMKILALDKFLAKAHADYPDAKVLLAGWDFYSTWNPKEVQALLPRLDPKRDIIWDYEGDVSPLGFWNNFTKWGLVGKFPYTFSMFLAYENALDARANYPLIEARQKVAQDDPFCKGYILWPESSHTDTLGLRFFTANAWSAKPVPYGDVLDEFCASRYGEHAELMKKAWEAALPASWLRGWGSNYGRHMVGLGFDAASAPGTIKKWSGPVKKAEAVFDILATAPWEDEFVRRDAIDIARMVLDRVIALRTMELCRDIAKWRRGECKVESEKCKGDGGNLVTQAEKVVALNEKMADLLALHTDYSLWESYQRLNAVEKIQNPLFEKTLFENASCPYCRSHQYELARHWYTVHVRKMAERLAKAVANGDRMAAFSEGSEEERLALKAKPLESLRPTLPRTAENFRKIMCEIHSCVMPWTVAGRWGFALGDAENCTDTITLPTTTDMAKKGDGRIDGKDVEKIAPERDDAAVTSRLTRHLTRRFPYIGKATYEREIEIPSEWNGRRIEISLERTKKLDAYIDGVHFAHSDTLAAPARLTLPVGVNPGRHRLRLVIDNARPPVGGHQVSEDTQTNWNGVLGRMEMRAYGEVSIAQVKTFPSAAENKVTAKVAFRNDGAKDARLNVEVGVSAGAFRTEPCPAQDTISHSFPYVAPCGVSTGEFTVALGPDAQKWSEFNPVLYTLTVRAGESVETVKFGLRDFRTKGTQFTLNGRPLFLRGTHDACVWPLTGAAPMEVEPWRKYFATLKEYGLNHVRFHSWCPPEAAFEAADEAGFFLQPEFGAFGGSFAKDARLRAFCLAESKRIIDAYGNHPSFVMFTLGNECGGGRKERSEIVRALKAHDPRPLYAIATNGDFMNPEQCEEDDFWATFRSCKGAEGNVRGSYAHCNAPLGAVQLPGGGTMRDFSSAVRHSTIPLIGHETGQFQAYPDYSEIPKYTGVLKPINLEVFRTRLEKAGLGKYAADFCRASGRLMAMNYREEMEEAFRTPGFGGFQLLDIKDFPGQGTALVGILNAFMESKGFITPEEWRMSCSPTVLLARFPRYTYVGGEKFGAEIQIAHYGKEDLLTGDLTWRIASTGTTGLLPVGGSFAIAVPVGEVKAVGKIDVELPRLQKAEKLELQLAFADGKVHNSYPLWVYPEGEKPVGRGVPDAPDGVEIVRDFESADKALAEGRTALCILDLAKAPTNAVPGFFASDFWNWEMFNGAARKRKVIAPGTLGLLVKSEHPALAGFPTSFHSDYQWRELIFKGVNVVLDGDKDADVIVRGIDNITRNQNLGVIWEKRRGKGRVLYCSLDLEAAKDLPEARALRRSLLCYIKCH